MVDGQALQHEDNIDFAGHRRSFVDFCQDLSFQGGSRTNMLAGGQASEQRSSIGSAGKKAQGVFRFAVMKAEGWQINKPPYNQGCSLEYTMSDKLYC